MAGGGKDAIQYLKQDVPKFIRDFKERTNQQPASDINSKKRNDKRLEKDDDDDDDKEREDEAPTVDLSNGVTTEEAEKFLKDKYGEESANNIIDKNIKRPHDNEGSVEEDGKVLFKKPSKEKTKDEKHKKKSKMKKVKNTTLLSFGEDEEEE